MTTDVGDVSLNVIDIPKSKNECKIVKDTVTFWATNPNIILDKNYVLELFPVDTMTYNQKLNAITRMVIILSIISFIVTKNIRMPIVSILTIGAIFFLHKFHTEKTIKNQYKSNGEFNYSREGFDGIVSDLINDNTTSNTTDVFQDSTPTNPFANVMVGDYDYNPNKKPAAPSLSKKTNYKIIENAKRLVEEANPGQPDISEKLFKDLGEQLSFEQSLRQFNSTPSTTIPNDQGAFADFCYGDMVSCKEGNNFACGRNTTNYTLY